MPTSNLHLAPDVITLVDQAHPTTILDVGPGRGKFGVLCREYVPTLNVIDAVEAWPDYVTDRLLCIYDHVFVEDVRNLEPETLASYDLVLMSEVIEHLPKEEGLALLDRIPGHVVITTPVEFFPSVNYPPTEKHVSHWTMNDFGDRIEADGSRLGGIVVRLAPKDACRQV
jgi:hypothetical protein